MIIHPFEPDRIPPRLSVLDEARLALDEILDGRHGNLRIADALVTLAAELAVREAGPRGASAWLRQVADDVGAARPKE